MKTICVIAAPTARVPYRDELGRVERGRYVGRGGDDTPAAELVPHTSDVRRALRRGDLLEATMPKEPDAPADSDPATAKDA